MHRKRTIGLLGVLFSLVAGLALLLGPAAPPTTAQRSPDLVGIHKSVTPARVGPGQPLTYTLAFSNSGEITATGVVISDIVPQGAIADLSYARSGAAITPTGSTSYTWQVEDLSPGESGLITITAVIRPDVSNTFPLTNRATISTTSEDLYRANDTAVVSSTVDGEPPLPPALTSPANGATLTDNTPTLAWQASPSADAVGYLLKLNGAVRDVGHVTEYTTSVLANGTYTWTVAAYDALSHTSAYTAAWSFTTAPQRFYLPLLTKGLVRAPDLVVERITANRDDVQVVIRNQGNTAVRDGFWVDVYIDPEPLPTAVNQIWNFMADEGLVWGVTRDLAPGEALTLTVGGDYYAAEYSYVAWPLATGTPVYAQVDSANLNTSYGAVLESHEITGGGYNNIGGPTYSPAVSGGGQRWVDHPETSAP